jgi:hypothetical protein
VSKTALSNGRSTTVVDVLVEVEVVELVVLVDDVDVVGATVVEVSATVVGSEALEVRTGGTDVEPAVAASESEPVIADASATMATPTTPTIMKRLATSSILAGLQPRTTAPATARRSAVSRSDAG